MPRAWGAVQAHPMQVCSSRHTPTRVGGCALSTRPTGRPRGRPKTHEYVTLMARVPLALADQARRYAGRHRQTMSAVLRDGLLILFQEEDPYRPYTSDTKTASGMMSDRHEAQPSLTSYMKEETATHHMQPVLLSDMQEAIPESASDTHDALPDTVSDRIPAIFRSCACLIPWSPARKAYSSFKCAG